MFQYHFFNRKSELKELIGSFEKKIAREKGFLGYIIQGRAGIGKTRLVDEFILRLNDVEILSDIPKFNPSKHVITHVCEREDSEPYKAFMKITEEIYRSFKWQIILIKTFQLGLAVFGINDALNAMGDLVLAIKKGKDERKLIKKETATFNSYRKFIKRLSSRKPMIIFIQNVQWLDEYSMKLIKKLVYDIHPMWGMIILEADSTDIEETIKNSLNQFILESKFRRLNLSPLEKTYPAKLLSSRFGKDFFTSEENDSLFTVSEGCPGYLVSFIENTCIREGWLRQERGEWIKAHDFFDKIKPPNQKLIELIVSLYQDKELSDGESRLIEKMAIMWGIPDVVVVSTINMVRDIMDYGFTIVDKLGPGIISKNSFAVLDQSNNRFIIEYIKCKNKIVQNGFKHRELDNIHLLEARKIKVLNEGIIIIWDYFEGKRSRQFLMEQFEEHIKKNIKKFLEISEGLATIHRNNTIHGLLKPEAIIENNNGSHQLASFDNSLINLLFDEDELIEWNDDIQYIAPEVLNNQQPTEKSDIFSLGILFYKSITDRFPFQGRNKTELLRSIENDKITFSGYLLSIVDEQIREIINKCLAFEPADRFSNAEEFHTALKKINLKPTPLPPPPTPLPVKVSLKKVAVTVIACMAVGILGYLIYEYIIRPPKEQQIKELITLQVDAENKDVPENGFLSPSILQYLICEDLMQLSDEVVLTSDQFNKIYPASRKEEFLPKIHIYATIISRKLNYELKVKLVYYQDEDSTVKETFDFTDPSELLKEIIPSLAKKISNKNKLRKYAYTTDWDAFINYYNGELAWAKVDKNNALRHFISAIAIDSGFLLAKLRLADIYRFEGSSSQASKVLSEVLPYLEELSKADSLRALAMNNQMKGNTREAINNLRDLLHYMPARKEPKYELAEAFFEVREIQNAQRYYEAALEIDPEFTQAINHYAYCFSHLGDHEQALKYFREYFALDHSANALDSYGDGLMTAGKLDSAEWAKLEGLKLDSTLEYLYNSLNYIQVKQGKFGSAENNINHYIKFQSEPELLAEGYCSKAMIYFHQGKISQALDTCLKAKSIFDSDEIYSRNHKIHWLLYRIYVKTGDISSASRELEDMEKLIEENHIDATNYNEILKYYIHCKAISLSLENKVSEIDELVNILNVELKEKVKDWSSPHDFAFLSTELGGIYLDLGVLNSAKKCLDNALDYNPHFTKAHWLLVNYYNQIGDTAMAEKHLAIFNDNWKHADDGNLMY